MVCVCVCVDVIWGLQGINGFPLAIYAKVLDHVQAGAVDCILSYGHYGLTDSSLVDKLPYLQGKAVGIINAAPLVMGLLTNRTVS